MHGTDIGPSPVVAVCTLAPGVLTDLDDINRVIAAGVETWPLAKRVRRLALPVLVYDAVDFDHYHFIVARFGRDMAGVAAWMTDGDEAVLHGLYVDGACHSTGIGSKLLHTVVRDAAATRAQTLRVRAERVAAGFFEHSGFERLVVEDDAYPWQYRCSLVAAGT